MEGHSFTFIFKSAYVLVLDIIMIFAIQVVVCFSFPLSHHPWLFLSSPDSLTPMILFLLYVPCVPLLTPVHLHVHKSLSVFRFVMIAFDNSSTYAL